MQITQEKIIKSLSELIDENDEIIVIHSSIMHLKLNPIQIKWPLLGALSFFVQQGYTIAIPSFTFSFTQTGKFDPLNLPSEVGVLGDWFRELYPVKRTLHPIYSFAVAGTYANEIMGISTDTCFSNNSIFSYFNKKRTRLVFIACEFKYATQLHFYEEFYQIPYRYHKTFSGILIKHGQSFPIKTTMNVRDLIINPINDYTAVVNELRTQKAFREISLGSSYIHSVSEEALSRVAQSLLKKDKFAFIKNKASVKYHLDCKASQNANPPIKIAILGNSNISLLAKSIQTEFLNFFCDRRLELYTPEYGQSYKEIFDNGSKLNQFSPDYIFFTDTIEDIYQVELLENIPKENFGPLKNYVSIIEKISQKYKASIFVNNFIRNHQNLNGIYDYTQNRESFINYCNEELHTLIKQFNNIHFINLYELVVANKGIYDRRLWYLGKFRYTQEFYNQLALKYIGCIMALSARGTRVLALDLDNTLWGGGSW